MCVVSLHHDITTGWDEQRLWVFAFLARCCSAAAPWLASARCSSSHSDCVYQLMLSQRPAGCAAAVRYLTSRSTNLIFLCTGFGLNSAADPTQPLDLCQSPSDQGQTFFTPICLQENSLTLLVYPCLTFPTDRNPPWNMLHKTSVTSNIRPSWKPTDEEMPLKVHYATFLQAVNKQKTEFLMQETVVWRS